MSNTIEIRIPNPCNESWDAMQPNGCARFCNSCEKVVVDFTKLSDEEFVSYFQNNEAIPCGRLTQRQLALSIPSKTQTFFRFGKMSKYIAASILAIIGLQHSGWSQPALTISQVPLSQKTDDETLIVKSEKVQLVGMVVDENGEPLPAAIVRIKEEKVEVLTDYDGNFLLETDKIKEQYTVVASWIGYNQTEKVIARGDKNVITLRPSESGQIMGIVIIQRPNFWQRITRPFKKIRF